MNVTEKDLAETLEDFRLPVFYHGETLNGASVADADKVAQALYAALSRRAALHGPEADVQWNGPGRLLLPEPDAELAAMQAVGSLDEKARERVLWYLARRYDVGL